MTPAEMTPLFKDNVGTWHYHDETKCYFRYDGAGVMNGKIFGKFLPDPEVMWSNRIEIYNRLNTEKITRTHERGIALKCRPETYKLWEHWQGVK